MTPEPTRCQFALVAVRLADRRNLLRCVACDREVFTIHTHARAPCRNAQPRGPCAHRSLDSVETRDCETCNGRVKLKLYACPLHTLCTIARPLEGAACCATCLDFRESTHHAPP